MFAHRRSLEFVFDYLTEEVIGKAKFVTMSSLRDIYVEQLRNTEFRNDRYPIFCIKRKIVADEYLSRNLLIVSTDRSFNESGSDVVFSTNIGIGDAFRAGFEFASEKSMQTAAQKIRNDVLQRYKKVKDSLSWPITAEQLQSERSSVPAILQNFLETVISNNSSPKTKRLANCISQDICRAVTNGGWKMPKHVVLSMTIRHLYRCAKLNTMLNRLGHCESYSFTLELESALATATSKSTENVVPGIVKNPTVPSLVHSDWDNFDSYVNSVTGISSIHVTHGIILQELDSPAAIPLSNLGDMVHLKSIGNVMG